MDKISTGFDSKLIAHFDIHTQEAQQCRNQHVSCTLHAIVKWPFKVIYFWVSERRHNNLWTYIFEGSD